MNGELKLRAKDVDGDGIPDEWELKLKLGRVAIMLVSLGASFTGYFLW